jgi:organic hydroperoxide reductase OsmC/OhrA
MSSHVATVEWVRAGAVFSDNRYSRAHRWTFDGGVSVPASSSPHVVKVPLSDPANVDPEEAFVAALSSCHMLWFLGLAASAGYVVDSYRDHGEGYMARAADGGEWMARLELRPLVVFSGSRQPTTAAVEQLHHAAHEKCFLARSVKTTIEIQGDWRYQGQAS